MVDKCRRVGESVRVPRWALIINHMISRVSGAECLAYTWHCRASHFFNYINENLQRKKSVPTMTFSGRRDEKGIIGHSHLQRWYTKFPKVSFSFCLSPYSCLLLLFHIGKGSLREWVKWSHEQLWMRLGQMVSRTALDAIFNLALSRITSQWVLALRFNLDCSGMINFHAIHAIFQLPIPRTFLN